MNARIIGPITVQRYNYDERDEGGCSILETEDYNCMDHIGELVHADILFGETYSIEEFMDRNISSDYQLTAPSSSFKLLDLDQE